MVAISERNLKTLISTPLSRPYSAHTTSATGIATAHE